MRLKTILGLAFIAVFGFLVVNSFGEQVGGYEHFAQAAESGRRAHVVGEWVRAQPTTYDPAMNQFSFWMRDEKGAVRQVVYPNPKPANFEDAEQVVVEGRMDGEVFAAEHILVKCPSKYNDERGLETPPAEAPASTTQPASLTP